MKRVLLIGVLFGLLASLASAAEPRMNLTPSYPFPNEHLQCRYLDFQPGNVLEFFWYHNNRLIERKVIDKPSTLFTQITVPLDKVQCQINALDPATLERNFAVGSKTVTVGQFPCNDGKDNDDDNLIDLQDPGCSARNDKTESQADVAELLAAFCSENPDNLQCLKLGLTDLSSLCQQHPENHLCLNQEALNLATSFCPENLEDPLCAGNNNIVRMCTQEPNDLACLFLAFTVINCRQGSCLELSENDKVLFCGLKQYYFCQAAEVQVNPGHIGEPCFEGSCFEGVCNQQEICMEAEINFNPGFVGNPCFEGACFEGVCSAEGQCEAAPLVEEEPVVALPANRPEPEAHQNVSSKAGPLPQIKPEQRESIPLPPAPEPSVVIKIPSVCGNAVCEELESKMCPQDCETKIASNGKYISFLAALVIIVGGGVGYGAYKLIKKKKKRHS